MRFLLLEKNNFQKSDKTWSVWDAFLKIPCTYVCRYEWDDLTFLRGGEKSTGASPAFHNCSNVERV